MSEATSRRRDAAHRRDTLWLAAMVHRVSGLLVAIFLPLHFLALGLAIEGEARLEGFIRWTDQPLVKLAETGLVLALVVHLAGGLRLLVIEAAGWWPGQKAMAHAALAAAFAIAVLFVLALMS